MCYKISVWIVSSSELDIRQERSYGNDNLVAIFEINLTFKYRALSTVFVVVVHHFARNVLRFNVFTSI